MPAGPPLSPPPQTPFDALPAELLLEIIRYLRIADYVSFTLAIYSTLQRHGLVPPLTEDIYNLINRNREAASKTELGESGGNNAPAVPSGNESHSHRPLPNELNEQIMHLLPPADRISWLLSDPGLLTLYLSELSEGTSRLLRRALDEARDAQQKL